MPNMTLSVPDDLHEIIKRHPEVSWSHVAREAMWAYARKVELLDALTAESRLTEEDVEEIGRRIKREIRKRHEDDGAEA